MKWWFYKMVTPLLLHLWNSYSYTRCAGCRTIVWTKETVVLVILKPFLPLQNFNRLFCFFPNHSVNGKCASSKVILWDVSLAKTNRKKKWRSIMLHKVFWPWWPWPVKEYKSMFQLSTWLTCGEGETWRTIISLPALCVLLLPRNDLAQYGFSSLLTHFHQTAVLQHPSPSFPELTGWILFNIWVAFHQFVPNWDW